MNKPEEQEEDKQPQEEERYNVRGGSRLVHKSPDLFAMLQRVYDKLTGKREMDEGFRVEVRDLLESIDHTSRP